MGVNVTRLQRQVLNGNLSPIRKNAENILCFIIHMKRASLTDPSKKSIRFEFLFAKFPPWNSIRCYNSLIV